MTAYCCSGDGSAERLARVIEVLLDRFARPDTSPEVVAVLGRLAEAALDPAWGEMLDGARKLLDRSAVLSNIAALDAEHTAHRGCIRAVPERPIDTEQAKNTPESRADSGMETASESAPTIQPQRIARHAATLRPYRRVRVRLAPTPRGVWAGVMATLRGFGL